MRKIICFMLRGATLLFATFFPVVTRGFTAPVLQWSYGGCGWSCEYAYYASPTVADLDGNGTKEVITAPRSQ